MPSDENSANSTQGSIDHPSKQVEVKVISSEENSQSGGAPTATKNVPVLVVDTTNSGLSEDDRRLLEEDAARSKSPRHSPRRPRSVTSMEHANAGKSARAPLSKGKAIHQPDGEVVIPDGFKYCAFPSQLTASKSSLMQHHVEHRDFNLIVVDGYSQEAPSKTDNFIEGSRTIAKDLHRGLSIWVNDVNVNLQALMDTVDEKSGQTAFELFRKQYIVDNKSDSNSLTDEKEKEVIFEFLREKLICNYQVSPYAFSNFYGNYSQEILGYVLKNVFSHFFIESNYMFRGERSSRVDFDTETGKVTATVTLFDLKMEATSGSGNIIQLPGKVQVKAHLVNDDRHTVVNSGSAAGFRIDYIATTHEMLHGVVMGISDITADNIERKFRLASLKENGKSCGQTDKFYESLSDLEQRKLDHRFRFIADLEAGWDQLALDKCQTRTKIPFNELRKLAIARFALPKHEQGDDLVSAIAAMNHDKEWLDVLNNLPTFFDENSSVTAVNRSRWKLFCKSQKPLLSGNTQEGEVADKSAGDFFTKRATYLKSLEGIKGLPDNLRDACELSFNALYLGEDPQFNQLVTIAKELENQNEKCKKLHVLFKPFLVSKDADSFLMPLLETHQNIPTMQNSIINRSDLHLSVDKLYLQILKEWRAELKKSLKVELDEEVQIDFSDTIPQDSTATVSGVTAFDDMLDKLASEPEGNETQDECKARRLRLASALKKRQPAELASAGKVNVPFTIKPTEEGFQFFHSNVKRADDPEKGAAILFINPAPDCVEGINPRLFQLTKQLEAAHNIRQEVLDGVKVGGKLDVCKVHSHMRTIEQNEPSDMTRNIFQWLSSKLKAMFSTEYGLKVAAYRAGAKCGMFSAEKVGQMQRDVVVEELKGMSLGSSGAGAA